MDADTGGPCCVPLDIRTNITEQQLKDAPQFSDDSWDSRDRDWETRTHRHYGVRENYWDLGPRGA